MTTLRVTVEDAEAEVLKELLKHINIVKKVEEEPLTDAILHEQQSPYERLKKIQEDIGDKQLFKGISNPAEWQRETRKGWNRDF